MIRAFAKLVALALCTAGCNQDRPIEQGSADGTAGDATASSESPSDATGDANESQATAGGDRDSTGASMSGATSSGSSGESDEGSDPPAYPEACYEPEAVIDVADANTPDGPLQIDEAWIGVDDCSGPYIELVELPSVTGMGRSVIIVFHDPTVDGTYEGIHTAFLIHHGATGTIDVLEPVGPFEGGVPNPQNHLHARIEIHDLGWDLSLELELIDCGVSACLCPCE